MRASKIKNSTPRQEDDNANRPSDVEAMMAEIQKSIKFFNEKEEQDPITLRGADKRHVLDESMRQNHCGAGNMSFSFAVEAPVEMEHQHKLIGQGWKKADAKEESSNHINKRQAKQKEKEMCKNSMKEEQISEKIKKLVSEVGQKVNDTNKHDK